jgi:hypothetical protein
LHEVSVLWTCFRWWTQCRMLKTAAFHWGKTHSFTMGTSCDLIWNVLNLMF